MRSKLDLLDLEFVFLQDKIMTASGFASQAQRRGLTHLRPAHLEGLHAAGILFPFYRLMKSTRSAVAAARREGASPRAFLLYTPTDAEWLKEYRDAGRLRDPTEERFRPWDSYERVVDGESIRTSEFLYSTHQLLGITRLKPLLRRMSPRPSVGGRPRYRVPRSYWAAERGHGLDLMVLLATLSCVYLPEVIRRGTVPHAGVESLHGFEEEFDPVGTLAWLGLDADAVHQQAERLLMAATFLDPLRDWTVLVRLIRPGNWDRLQGDALAAMDYRIAAEMLLRFYEDLSISATATPLPVLAGRAWHPLDDRMRGDPAELDEVLTDFGLSPHPAMLLILEGETEMRLVPRVMDFLGIPRRRSLIQLIDAHGVDTNLDTLISYAVTPALGRELPRGVMLARPPTHVLVVLDPERSFATPAQRESRQQQWVDRIMTALDARYRTEVIRAQVDGMVQTDTWDGEVFEFAHFTDPEIARAVNRVLRRVGATGWTVTREAVAAVRGSPYPNIENLWKRVRPRKPSKPEVAEELWPTLERRLARARQRGRLDRIPIARVLATATEAAFASPRHGVMLLAEEEPNERQLGHALD